MNLRSESSDQHVIHCSLCVHDARRENCTQSEREYHHCLPFSSRCRSWFRGVIDHVFYSSESNIRPVRALQGLPSDWLRDNDIIGLPTADIPSDHLPLVVDFWLIPRSAAAAAGCTPSPEVQTVRKVRNRPASKRRSAPRSC
jgi:mRNA deadenylase 3'-5' endonuclease subunit Ccr4